MAAFFSKYGIFCAFVVLAVVLAVMSPAFRTLSNVENIVQQISVNGIMSVGMTMVILTGGIDLSVGSVLALSAVVATSFAHPGEHNLIVPVAIGICVGLFCGFLNGLLIARERLAPFIITLAMMTIARGAALHYTGGRPIIELSDSYNKIGGASFCGVPNPAIVFFLVVVSGAFVLHFTRFGRYVYAVGGNELAAKVSGVNTNRILVGVYAFSGALAGVAGIVLSSRIMSGPPATGLGYELDAIAAVVIGGTSLSGGIGSIGATIVGVMIIGVMNNGLDLIGVTSYSQQIIKGVIIVLAVLLDKRLKA